MFYVQFIVVTKNLSKEMLGRVHQFRWIVALKITKKSKRASVGGMSLWSAAKTQKLIKKICLIPSQIV